MTTFTPTRSPLMNSNPIFLKQCNKILQALPEDEWNRWFPYLEFVDLKTGQSLYNQSSSNAYIYFPITCIISLMCELDDGASIEYGHIGNEGMVGGHLLAATPPATRKIEVIHSGACYKIHKQIAQAELEKSGPFRRLLMRYMFFQMFTSAQLLICTRKHNILQQLSKLLLSIHDKISGDELSITQELLSNLLGVRREGVSEAINKLNNMGLIEHKRGSIVLVDINGLKNQACECYQLIEQEKAKMLPKVTAI